MSTFTISTRSSSTNTETSVSLTMPNAYRPPTHYAPMAYLIEGPLPEGRELNEPIVVLIEDDDEEFVVGELKFYMHASGPTISEAIEAFKRVISGYLDVLSSDEDRLGSFLQEQLEYLRSVI